MRHPSLLKLALALILIVTLVDAAPPAPAWAACAAPITPGTWSGPFSYALNGQGTQTGDPLHPKTTQLSETVTGRLTLQVACDGTLTGSVSNEVLSLQITTIITNTKSNKSATFNSACTGTSRAAVTGGSVAAGAGGLPVFTLNATVTWDAFTCSDPDVQKAYDQSGGSAGYSATFTLTAGNANATAISGTAWDSSDRQFEIGRANLIALGFTPTVVITWQLNGPPPSATATPEPDAPVILSLVPLYQQYFLLGVHSVPNQYTAVVDWKNGTPGKVVFTLGSDPAVEVNAQPYVFSKEMGDLPGSAVLSVVAINGEGQSSAAKQMSVDIVPLPAWAQRLSFGVLLKNGYVLYRTQQAIPAQPFNKGYIEVPDGVPFYGGPYGFTAFQLNANLTIDSRGQQGQDQVSGLGGAAWGKDKQVDLTIDGDTFTTLSAAQLSFDRGAAQVNFPPVTFRKYYGLLDLIPGAQAFYSWPFVGRILRALNELASIGGEVSANIGGKGNLGIKNDRLDATSGRVTLGAEVLLNLVRLGIDEAYVSVGGGGRGNVAVRFTPDWGLESCTLSMFLRAVARAFKYQISAEPNLYNYTCPPSAGLAPRTGLDAPPDMQLRVPPRPAGWRPEQAVVKVSASGDVTTTVLVEKANPDAAPRLALSPNGQAALTWVEEDPARPRPQADDIRLRLFDGRAWGQPIAITHDTRPDFNPQAAFDGNGHVIVAWVQNRLDNLGADSTLDDNFLKNLEITYAVVDVKTGAVASTGQLTNDSALDFDPHLAAARDGTVWLAWQSSPQLASVGEAAAPNQLLAAAWDGKQWSAVETVTGQLVGTLWWSLATQDRQTALVAADAPAPGAATGGNGREIFVYQRAAKGWAAPRQITHNSVLDTAPRAAFTPEGQPALAWYSDQNMVGLVGDLGAAPSAWFTTTVDSGFALSAGSLLAGPGGQLALVWPGSTPSGPYDPQAKSWAGPAPIFADDAQEVDVSAAARADGSLVLGLARLAATTESVPVPGGPALDVPASAASASLVVAEVPHVFSQAGEAQPSNGGPLWLVLIGLLCVALIAIGGLGLVFGLRRRR